MSTRYVDMTIIADPRMFPTSTLARILWDWCESEPFKSVKFEAAASVVLDDTPVLLTASEAVDLAGRFHLRPSEVWDRWPETEPDPIFAERPPWAPDDRDGAVSS